MATEPFPSLNEVEKIIGYKFRNPSLLHQAFTHASCLTTTMTTSSYELLEYIGDSVLNVLISTTDYFAYPKLLPGKLTRLQSANVDTKKLGRVAVERSLYNYLRHKNPQLDEQIRQFMDEIADYHLHSWGLVNAPKVLADIVESIIGAIFIDSRSIDTTGKVVKRLLEPMITPQTLQTHPVTKLTELCQKRGLKLDYVDLWSASKEFKVLVDNEIVGRAHYPPKKAIAVNRAANNAYEEIMRRLNAEENIWHMHQISEVAQLHDDAQEVVEEVNLISNPQNDEENNMLPNEDAQAEIGEQVMEADPQIGHMHQISEVPHLHDDAQEVVDEVNLISNPQNVNMHPVNQLAQLHGEAQEDVQEVNPIVDPQDAVPAVLRQRRGRVRSRWKFGRRTMGGIVILPQLPNAPTFFETRFTNANFMDNIRSYNSMMSFTSMGGKVDHSVLDGRGPYTFRISGENYHRIGSLLPTPGQKPKFAQLYIYDTEHELQNRVDVMGDRGGGRSTIDLSTLEGLKEMLNLCNPYVQIFRTTRDAMLNQNVPSLHVHIMHSRGERQYIRPTANEVAAIIIGDDTGVETHRDIIVHNKDEASTWASASKLRNMYCTMLMFSDVTNPLDLWERHWKSLTDDLMYRLRRDASDNALHIEDETLKNLGLLEIEHILKRNGRSLKDFPPMPMPSVRDAHFVTNRLIREELEYDVASEHQMFDELFAVLHLKTNIRIMANAASNQAHRQLSEFAEWILRVGEGKIPGIALIEGNEPNWIEIPQQFLIRNGNRALHELINAIYPELSVNYKDHSYLKERGILAPKNTDVDELNSIMLSMIPGESRTYLSADTLCPIENGDIVVPYPPFADLVPYGNKWKVKARLIRMVQVITSHRVTLKLVLLDEQGHAMEAIVGPEEVDYFRAHLYQGRVYFLRGVDILPADEKYNFVPYHYKMSFSEDTRVDHVVFRCDEIPLHWDFSEEKEKPATEPFPSLNEVEKIIGYKFRNPSLLHQAFTHASCLTTTMTTSSYELLEYIGDSVLNVLISTTDYFAYPKLLPGKLTRLQSANVDTKKLGRVAVERGLYNYLRHKNPQLDEQIRQFMDEIADYHLHSWGLVNAPKVLADIVESIIGAIFIDSRSIDTTGKVVKRLLEPMITPQTLQTHPVTKLTELCQKRGLKLDYVDLWSASKEFKVLVDNEIVGRAHYPPKKAIAVNRAANNAYEEIMRRLNAEENIWHMHQISEVAQLHDDAQEVVEEVNLISNPQNGKAHASDKSEVPHLHDDAQEVVDEVNLISDPQNVNMHPVNQLAQLHGEAQEDVQEVNPIVDPQDAVPAVLRQRRGRVRSRWKFGRRTMGGIVILPQLPNAPTFFETRFTNANFMDNIRSYNSMMSFTSMGGKVDHSVLDGRGPYTFRISGENYHRIGSLLPTPGQKPKFAQLYIYDTEHELQNRVDVMGDRGGGRSTIDLSTLEGLKEMLNLCNPYVQIFRTTRDAMLNQNVPSLHVHIMHSRGERQYIRPTANEVAAIIIGDDTVVETHRDIIVHNKDEASTWASASKLRNMYCTMLMFSDVTNPLDLWERHWKSLTDDLMYRLRRDASDNALHIEDETLKNLGLLEIEHILNRNGRSLKDFSPMPMPSVRDAHFVTNRLIREELEYDVASEHQMFDELFAVLHLRTNMRIMANAASNQAHRQLSEFAEWILRVGEGKIPGIALIEGNEPNWIEIPQQFLIRNGNRALHELINAIYPELSVNYKDHSYLKERGILAPKKHRC
ncbi:hypothetical protein Vadar_002294 [Vaccinium darrowii]|uniref:Uncharacterized protein n=1 Tax=Vaccinium darrowii TaxID=229202 RepID=A0ACB7YBK1_9ERIC|nr:hypothetical protein Vadar_002294 [Vaccinium darrowii]